MNQIFYIIFLPALLISFITSCSHRPLEGPMSGWDHMMGYGSYGGLFMWLIWIVIIGLIVYFIIGWSQKKNRPAALAAEKPLEILKRRYAAGEISKAEFEELKKDVAD